MLTPEDRDAFNDAFNGAFAAGMVFDWLHWPESAGVLKAVLEALGTVPSLLAWESGIMLAGMLRWQDDAARHDELDALLDEVGLDLDDVDWIMLGEQLRKDCGGPAS